MFTEKYVVVPIGAPMERLEGIIDGESLTMIGPFIIIKAHTLYTINAYRTYLRRGLIIILVRTHAMKLCYVQIG